MLLLKRFNIKYLPAPALSTPSSTTVDHDKVCSLQSLSSCENTENLSRPESLGFASEFPSENQMRREQLNKQMHLTMLNINITLISSLILTPLPAQASTTPISR
jgi:hypothetical protein